MSDPLPWCLEGERFASNRYPHPGWGEFSFDPRHGYDDHECEPFHCEDWTDPEPYVTVYSGTGYPLFSRHSWSGNGTAYQPRDPGQYETDLSTQAYSKDANA